MKEPNNQALRARSVLANTRGPSATAAHIRQGDDNHAEGRLAGLEEAAKVAEAERAAARESHHEATDTSERAYRRGRGEAATAIGTLIHSLIGGKA